MASGVIRLRFHRLVLRDGRQSSHLTSEETEAHREDGFPPTAVVMWLDQHLGPGQRRQHRA